MRKLSDPWIFISHSNTDLLSVRVVRNALEAAGAHPILFFLKAALPAPHLRELIFAEIDARHLFLLCDSPAARSSAWVQEEVSYVEQKKQHKRKATIDLSLTEEEQRLQMRKILSASIVFISAAYTDAARVAPYVEALRDHDLEVWWDDFAMSTHWANTIKEKIELAAEDGVFLHFFSNASVFSRMIEVSLITFLREAQGKRGRFLPVLIDPVGHHIPPALQRFHRLDCTGTNLGANIDRVVSEVFA